LQGESRDRAAPLFARVGASITKRSRAIRKSIARSPSARFSPRDQAPAVSFGARAALESRALSIDFEKYFLSTRSRSACSHRANRD